MAVSFDSPEILRDYTGSRHILLIKTGNIGTYATDGVGLTIDQIGEGAQLLDITIEPRTKANILLYSFKYDFTTKKVVGFTNADGAEIADTTNLAGVSLKFTIRYI